MKEKQVLALPTAPYHPEWLPAPTIPPDVFGNNHLNSREALRLFETADKIFNFEGNNITPCQQVYIIALLTHGTKLRACQSVGVDPREVTSWERRKEFAHIHKHALLLISDILEEEAIKRAMNGSDKLLITMLKATNPDKYTERRLNKHEGEIKHTINSWADLAKKVAEAENVIDVDSVEREEEDDYNSQEG